jgi:glutathione reductase (NADPH)
VHENLKLRGIRVITKTNINEIKPLGDEFNVVLSNGETIDVGKVMLALGRKPYVKGLGLESVGVEIENDAIKVDEYSKTNIDNIYAVGDVTNRINLTPVAIREGAAFAATIFNNKPTKMNYENVASAVFSQPPVGTVGLTEHEARAKFGQVDIYRTRFRPMRIALSNDQTRVMMKLVVRASDNVVVGVHIVGDDAPEMIQMVAIAIKAGLTKEQFDETCAVHPTMAEELVTLK